MSQSRAARTDEMRSLFVKWESSGLSLHAFGIREGIAYATLLYWKKKFAGPSAEAVQATSPVELVPVRVADVASQGDLPASTSSRGSFEVWLGNGIGVDIPPGFDEQELQRLLRVLSSC